MSLWPPFILKNNHVKKAYTQTLNIPMASFTLKVKKGHFQTPKTTITLQIKKHKIKLKSILTNRKIHGTVFLLIPFSNIKKAYLRFSKYLAQFFCSSPFQILKKHTYESQNTLFHTNNYNNNNFKGNNLYDNHYTNNSHKNNYTNR